MNESVLDQLPMLSDLLRALEELQLMGDKPIAERNPFIVQQIPEIRTNILKDKDWKEIAEYQ